MRKLISVVVTAATVMALSPAFAAEELGRGHITAGGPWIQFRSVTVLTNADSVDGFFLDINSGHRGRTLDAVVYRNGSGAPYALSVNFHGANKGNLGRNWLGGCSGTAVDQNLAIDLSADVHDCRIPAGATTVEVTAYWGADLDVIVTLD